ncbi:MAG: cysteine hydrolase family protein [Eubacterium sp.]
MKTLIVVDMQNDFIDGALGTKEAVAIVPNVKDKIDQYREAGDQVIFTRDTHFEDYLETQEGRNLPVKHCIKGTTGWEISKELDVRDNDIIFDKISFGFDWAGAIAKTPDLIQGDAIQFVGLCTDICVIANALSMKTALPEIPLSVDANCCAGVTPESHNNALEAMKMCQITIA